MIDIILEILFRYKVAGRFVVDYLNANEAMVGSNPPVMSKSHSLIGRTLIFP